MMPGAGTFAFLLGLPALRPGALWAQARRLGAPVLVSANALSRWRTDIIGLRHWGGFDGRHLPLVQTHPVALDSAGFTAARLYRGFPWSVDDYLDLAATAPWLWWASMDLCVEPEIAGDEEEVLNRISGTVRLNMLCRRGGERRAVADRFVPVLQGWHPSHYMRCLERMPWAADFPLVGIGSMCRRHVHGEHGVLHVLDALDRAFDGSDARFHLFGLKSQAIALACQHPRVASADSQAYGTAARQRALRQRASKTDRVLARAMADWHARQVEAIASLPPVPLQKDWPARATAVPIIAAAMEDLRALHEEGEIDWQTVNPIAALEMAFLDD